MFTVCCRVRSLGGVLAAVVFLLIQVSFGQDQSTLLRLQRSKMSAEVDVSGGMRGAGGNVLALGGNASEMGTAVYPSSASCLSVYNDGRFILEKRDEQKVGKPKTKSVEGTLSAEDLQQLKSILNSDEIKKVTGLKPVEPPERAQLMREAETMEVQITRDDGTQHFLATKQRYKTLSPGSSDLAATPSTGLDTYLDNASAYRKNLNPLVKWFEGIEKRNKSSFKDSKPQACVAMTM